MCAEQCVLQRDRHQMLIGDPKIGTAKGSKKRFQPSVPVGFGQFIQRIQIRIACPTKQ